MKLNLRKFKKAISDAKYWVFYRVHPKHRYNRVHMTSLEPGYYDHDVRILHASFDLFAEFMKVQLDPDRCIVQWDFSDIKPDEFTSQEEIDTRAARWAVMNELYTWWTVTRPNRNDGFPTRDLIADLDILEVIRGKHNDDPNVIAWKEEGRIHFKQSEAWVEEDTAMLHKLIDIRLALWD